MWHLSSESSPCTLRAGKTLPADNRIIKKRAACGGNFTVETRRFVACVQIGGVRPRNRVSRPGLDRIGPETRQSRHALERVEPGQSDSRPVAGDCEFIWMIADFVRVIPGCRRSRSSSRAVTAGSKPPACHTVSPIEGDARASRPEATKRRLHRGHPKPVGGARKHPAGHSQRRIGF
jgi:hypothetical protein